MINAFRSGGSVILKMTVETAQMNLQIAVSTRALTVRDTMDTQTYITFSNALFLGFS